jgi:hypothetical protein
MSNLAAGVHRPKRDNADDYWEGKVTCQRLYYRRMAAILLKLGDNLKGPKAGNGDLENWQRQR